MYVMDNALGLQNGNHGIPYSLQGRGEAAVGAGAVSNCNGGAATAVTLQAPKGDTEIVEEWTTEQQAILEKLLKKYASDSPVIRYAKIGLRIPEKKIQDVTFRCKWVIEKKAEKRRTDDSLPRKSKNKKERATDSSAKTSCHLPVQPNDPPNSMSMLPIHNDDDISHEAIGGPIGHLLEHTAEIFNQISTNFTNFQINDNIGLLYQARENILEVMNELHDIPPELKKMPPLPFKLNEELANTILPSTIPQRALHPQTCNSWNIW